MTPKSYSNLLLILLGNYCAKYEYPLPNNEIGVRVTCFRHALHMCDIELKPRSYWWSKEHMAIYTRQLIIVSITNILGKKNEGGVCVTINKTDFDMCFVYAHLTFNSKVISVTWVTFCYLHPLRNHCSKYEMTIIWGMIARYDNKDLTTTCIFGEILCDLFGAGCLKVINLYLGVFVCA